MPKRFRDREEAGAILAEMLRHYAGRHDVVVLGLPRGGVPVAAVVAHALRAPLDVFVVRKLGTPGHEELAMGAIASGGVRVLNRDVIDNVGVSRDAIDRVAAREERELERREEAYRGGRPPEPLDGRVAILVDDGMATGSSMRAALAAARQRHPARVVVAVPTGAAQTCRELETEADEVVCVLTPTPFVAVGLWYRDFAPTTDEEVSRLVTKQVPSEQSEGEQGNG